MFEDREEAGERLADELQAEGVTADVVTAIPRGGLPPGRAAADRLGVPLDVVVASKMGAPSNPEYAVGAVAEDGSVWLNDDAIYRLEIDNDYIATERNREREAAEEKAADYRERSRPSFTDERVVVVDDGVATGATMRACLQSVIDDDPERVVVGVPVGPPGTLELLESLADDVIAVDRPRHFRSVGSYYRRFDQVTDDEAKTYL